MMNDVQVTRLSGRERAERRETLERELRAATYVPFGQLSVAYRLASAHGHRWAGPQSELLGDGTTLAEIDAATLTDSDDRTGILAPTVDDYDQIVHTTGSGRLSWTITSPIWSGTSTAWISVSRAQVGAVLRAHVTVDPKGKVTDSGIDDSCLSEHIRARHVDALATALRSLLSEVVVDELLEPAWDAARANDPADVDEFQANLAAYRAQRAEAAARTDA